MATPMESQSSSYTEHQEADLAPTRDLPFCIGWASD
jgi:hypothetical protein